MHTVNFSCPLCGKLMGVASELLGKQVRCPHCQQVIVAPPPAVAPAVAPLMTFQTAPPRREDDSIFAPPEEGDDLFNVPAPGLQVEIPPQPPPLIAESSVPAAPFDATAPELTMPLEPAPFFPPAEEGTVAYIPEPSATVVFPSPSPTSLLEPSASAPLQDPWAASESPSPEMELISGSSSAIRLAEQTQQHGSVLPILVLIFVVPYALIMTVVAYVYWNKWVNRDQPLEMLPDKPGDHTGATRSQGNTEVIKRVSPLSELPAKLKVALGGTLRVGDLEITPRNIEQRQVVHCYENSMWKPEPSQADALVLNLKLRNVSEDVTFVPTDAAFFRQSKSSEAEPYAFLDLGGQRYFGGACPWAPRGQSPAGGRQQDSRQYIEGQENGFKPLKPGQQVETLVCTDPDRPEILDAVKNHSGPITWRVQLRRGLVKVKDRDVAASAVIGVVFEAKDIKQ